MNSSMSVLFLILLLSGCSHVEPDNFQEYLALAPATVELNKHSRLDAFNRLFNGLHQGDLSILLPEAYSEQLYFNDTLITLHDRKSLLEYFQHTQSNLDAIKVEILSVLDEGDDTFVRWKMNTRFTALGQIEQVESVGITHLRFNRAGKIILHQDYWDSMQGVYLHLPVIGGVLQWLKNTLHH
jgi:hypothetical protein